MKTLNYLIFYLAVQFFVSGCSGEKGTKKDSTGMPNILFAISDDQSFAHTSFAGSNFVKTPAFDRIASEGIYFNTCYAGSPGCAPSRSSLVTGRYHWQNEQSGQHASSWMKKYVPFIDILDQGGYYTGRTGKGVDPFQYARDENDSMWRATNAAGIEHSRISYGNESDDERSAMGISKVNYFENFRYFMEHREEGTPFFFWYGGMEPHRDYEEGSWMRNGMDPVDVSVPPFLPDDPVIRKDMLDYAVEVEWFDLHLSRMINYLEEIGELENTIIIVSSDNGMPFPRAKANGYEFGVHVPLAIRFPAKFPGGRIVDDPVSFVDLAPTILQLTGMKADGMLPISGKSFLNILISKKDGMVDSEREYVFAGRERHSCSRYLNMGYPMRIIRSRDHLLVWNMKPDLWPAGDPQAIKPGTVDEILPMYGIDENGIHHSEWAFTDVDASPSKSFLAEKHADETIHLYFELAYEKRPEFELYDLANDPYCLHNVSGEANYSDIESTMLMALKEKLKETDDPRIAGPDPGIFDSYLRYSRMRQFPVHPDYGK